MSRRALIIALGVALAIVVSLTLSRRANPPAIEMLGPPGAATALELPHLWQIPDFTLTERSGQPLGLAQLQGHIWIADFFYTTCPGPCPRLSIRLGELQQELGGQPDIRFVSISSDPEKDRPEVLSAYAKQYHAGPRWFFLTGDKQAIYDLANKGFKLSVVEDKTNAEGPIVHSTMFLLIDRTGTVRGNYDGLSQEGKGKLLRDVGVLLSEKQ